jgi:mono/diheme cytochrome c family protein
MLDHATKSGYSNLVIQHPRLMGLAMPRAALSILVAFLVAGSLTGRTEGPKPRSVYKNPLDVSVDEHGRIAKVVLTGPRTEATVDLLAAKVIAERPWPTDRRLPAPPDVPLHEGRKRRSLPYEEVHVGRSQYTIGGLATRDDLELHILRFAKNDIPATHVPQGWVFMNALSGRRGKDMKASFLAATDEPQRGFADLRDVEVGEFGRAFIASAGTDLILVVNLDAAFQLPKRHGQLGWSTPALDLSASRRFVIAKLPTQANPRRLALSGNGKTLVVSNYLADSLTVIDAEKLQVVKHIPLGGPAADAARRGEILFNSARLTQFGQFTCASCHPDGREDGLAWDLTRDGVGNFKNTKSLLGVKDAAPYGWLGSSPTLADRVAGTLRTLHRYEPSEQEVSDLVAYLETLEASARPEPSAAATRGKILFEGKARCAGCHPGPTFQDGKLHDVGTGNFPGEDRIDTPSLRDLLSTPPYLHDGRAATLEEVFTKHSDKKKHGDADQLTPGELRDLIAYLQSL